MHAPISIHRHIETYAWGHVGACADITYTAYMFAFKSTKCMDMHEGMHAYLRAYKQHCHSCFCVSLNVFIVIISNMRTRVCVYISGFMHVVFFHFVF